MLQTVWPYRTGTFLVTLSLSLALLVSACTGPAQESTGTPELPAVTSPAATLELLFETVDRSDYARYTGNFWEVAAPGIAIIAEATDVEQLGAFITPDSQAKLRALDYDTYFAIAAFLDVQGCDQLEWGIERVQLREDELEVYATYPQYDPERGCAIGFYMPYHVIRIPRDGVCDEATRFTLYLNEEHAVTSSYPPVVSQATPVPQPKVSPAPTYFMPGPTRTPSSP